MIGVQLKGVESILKKFKSYGGTKVLSAVEKELHLGALDVQATARKSIQAHLSQGETYKRGSVTHVASKPGNPPNSDTGRLVQSIQVDFGPLVARVGTNLKYGKWLEYGTEKVKARPWLRPALSANRETIQENVTKAVKKALKGK